MRGNFAVKMLKTEIYFAVYLCIFSPTSIHVSKDEGCSSVFSKIDTKRCRHETIAIRSDYDEKLSNRTLQTTGKRAMYTYSIYVSISLFKSSLPP